MRNLKRVLSLALAAMMLIGMMVVGASAANALDFTDYDEIKNTEAVNTMVALNVIAGKEDGSYFAPSDTLTRAEMSKIITYVLNGGEEPALGTKDVPTYADIDDTWAEKYIEYCTSAGIIAGDGAGNFNPNGTLTGEQFAKTLLTAMGYNAEVFKLVGNNWAVNTNRYANEAGLYDDLGGMDPSASISRDDACQMAYNAIQAPLMIRTWQQSQTTGEIIEEYALAVDNAGNTLNSLLIDRFDGDIAIGYLVGYSYDSVKNLWTYTFMNDNTGTLGNVLTGNDVIGVGEAITRQSSVDFTALYGQQVKVVYSTEDRDVLYGVYANDSSVIVEGFSGDVTADNVPAANDNEFKIDGVTYKLPGRADATAVITHQAGGNAGTLDNMDNIAGHYTYKMLDNDGDNRIDVVVITPFTVGKVTYVGSDSITVTLQNGDVDNTVSGNLKLEDVIVYDGIAKNDYVMCTNAAFAVKEDPTFTKLETTTGTITGLRDTTGGNQINEYKIDGAWYTDLTGTTLNSGDEVEYIALGSHIYYVNVVSGTIGVDAVAVVYNIADKAGSGISSACIEAGLMIADGSKIVGEVVEVNGYELDGETTASNVNGTNAAEQVVNVQINSLKGELVKYEVDSSGSIHVWTIPGGYDAAANDTQIMGFDGTISAGAVFDNATDKVNGYEIADDTVVFVLKGTSAKVYTGKELKNTEGDFGDDTNVYASGLYGKTNGFTSARVVVLAGAEWPEISTGANYGYLVSNATKQKIDGVWYRCYEYWDGSEVVTAMEKDKSDLTNFVAGSIITFDDNGDGTIKNVSLPEIQVGFITGVNSDGRVQINNCATNSKYNDDTVILYVDSADTVGVAGGEIAEGVDLDNDGNEENNVLYLTGGNNTFALIVVDVRQNMQNVNGAQLAE